VFASTAQVPRVPVNLTENRAPFPALEALALSGCSTKSFSRSFTFGSYLFSFAPLALTVACLDRPVIVLRHQSSRIGIHSRRRTGPTLLGPPAVLIVISTFGLPTSVVPSPPSFVWLRCSRRWPSRGFPTTTHSVRRSLGPDARVQAFWQGIAGSRAS